MNSPVMTAILCAALVALVAVTVWLDTRHDHFQYEQHDVCPRREPEREYVRACRRPYNWQDDEA